MRPVLSACIAVLVFALAGAADAGAPRPAKPVHPERFFGTWYEVARTPNPAQKGCFAAVARWSRAADGRISVVNSCRKGSPTGPEQTWKGVGRVIDAAAARVSVAFLGGVMKQEYWVLDRADDYSWSIMGTPGGNYVWVFSRKPVLTPAEKNALMARVKALGYNVSKLELAGRN